MTDTAPQGTGDATAQSSVRLDSRESRRIVLSSAVGTTIEFYDFGLYGLAAALVFGPQFFPSSSPVVSQLGAFATFSLGFVARPLGGIVAGHFGDRIGRKRVMLLSFLVMGSATFLVAFLPTYATIGVAAPALLVLLRIIQGLAAGAEWGGAALMAVEHAPPGKRGRYGSAPAFGTSAGSLLSSTMFLIVSVVDKQGFASFGWRIAFGASILLIILGLYLRRRITESPLFEAALKNEPPKVPLLKVLTEHPVAVLRGMSWVLVSGSTGYIVNTYGVSYAIDTTGLSRHIVLIVLNIGYVAGLIANLSVGRFIDRRRRRVLIAAAVAQIPIAVLLFPLLAVGSLATVALAFILVFAGVGTIEATRGAVLTELFPVEIRYSGVSLSYNVAYVLAGTAPLLAASIVGSTGSITWMVVILTVVALIAVPVAFHRPRRDKVVEVVASASPTA